MTKRAGMGKHLRPYFYNAMGIEEVALIIGRIADGFEDACVKCLQSNKEIVLQAVKEQMYSGFNGEAELLSPNYDDDPFFEEEGYWYHRGADYKAWKRTITPPLTSSMLGLPPRPEEVPNLFIDGTFYGEITARDGNKSLELDPGSGNGPAIVDKYGDELLEMGPTATEYFTTEYMLPAIGSFFNECGYR